MCHEFISRFYKCSHDIKGGVVECAKADQNDGQICHPLSEPTIVDHDDTCLDCKLEESSQAKEEMKRIMEESMKLHEDQMVRNRQESEEKYEKALRWAVEESANVYNPPHMPLEDQLRLAMQESLAVAQTAASEKKLYYRQAFQYLGCGCTKVIGILPIERNSDDTEALIEEMYGRCPEHDGESSSMPLSTQTQLQTTGVESSQPVLQPWQNPEDDPVPGYMEYTPAPGGVGKGKFIVGHRLNDPKPRAEGVPSSMPSLIHGQAEMPRGSGSGQLSSTEPGDEDWMSPPPEMPLSEDDEEGEDLNKGFENLPASTIHVNIHARGGLPPTPTQLGTLSHDETPSGPPPFGTQHHLSAGRENDDFESGSDDNDDDSDDEDPNTPARRPVTVSTLASINAGGVNKPQYMAGGLGSLEEDEEEDRSVPRPGDGGRR